MKMKCFAICALLAAGTCLGAFAADAASAPSSHPVLSRGGLTVRPNDCPKCPFRMRIDPDARTAYVNMARVSAADYPQTAERAFRIMEQAADARKGGRLRPAMGWSSWNAFELNVSADLIGSVAEAMATNGLRDAGYVYVNIDDGHFYGRDANGRLRAHPVRFPDGLKPVVDRIHALGMKAGIYSDAGRNTCGSLGATVDDGIGVGFYQHEDQDARYYFGDCGFDYVKVDWCGGTRLRIPAETLYTAIRRAIDKVKKDVRLSVCCWSYPGAWARDVADSWRTTGDIRANWESVRDIVAYMLNADLPSVASLGHYNDMDMLEVGHLKGKTKTPFGSFDTGLTRREEEAHFGMWCFLSSPLLIGCDVRKLDETTLRLVTSPFLLAMNQNDLGAPVRTVSKAGDCRFVLVKDCERPGGFSRYLALFNGEDAEHAFDVSLASLGLSGSVAFFDLVERADVGAFADSFRVTVPAHGAKFYRLDAETPFSLDALERAYDAQGFGLLNGGLQDAAREWTREVRAPGGARIYFYDRARAPETVFVGEKAFCVVDVSAGPDAARYPVAYLDAAPTAGWGDEYKTSKILLRRIEPGTFAMGGRATTLTKPYYIGVFPVTQGQYQRVMGGTPLACFPGERRPVECTTWSTIRGDAKTYDWPSVRTADPASFVGRIQARTGLALDLPTEAQWEYACRAGTTGAGNNGDDVTLLARCNATQRDGRGGFDLQHTTVGSYLPNAWGLYDMLGNVCEWCLDWHGDIDSRAPATDPVGPAAGAFRVRRGGSWFHDARFCTPGYRRADYPSYYDCYYYGFRLTLSAAAAAARR